MIEEFSMIPGRTTPTGHQASLQVKMVPKMEVDISHWTEDQKKAVAYKLFSEVKVIYYAGAFLIGFGLGLCMWGTLYFFVWGRNITHGILYRENLYAFSIIDWQLIGASLLLGVIILVIGCIVSSYSFYRLTGKWH